MAAAMVAAGFTTVEGIAQYADEESLVEALGITEDEARDIMNKAQASC